MNQPAATNAELTTYAELATAAKARAEEATKQTTVFRERLAPLILECSSIGHETDLATLDLDVTKVAALVSRHQAIERVLRAAGDRLRSLDQAATALRRDAAQAQVRLDNETQYQRDQQNRAGNTPIFGPNSRNF